MTFYQKLERKLGRFTVPNLMKYICVMYVVGYFILMLNPAFYIYYLSLNPQEILHGQIWRIITFLFYPPSTNFIWMALGVFVYYSLGITLERVWGSFHYNVFFFQGVLLLVLGDLVLYLLGIPLILFPIYMSFSIFLAYAMTFPDAVFLFYFIIPIKAKWLAGIEMVLYCLMFLTGSVADKAMIALSFLNVALFFFLSQHRTRGGNGKIHNINDYR